MKKTVRCVALSILFLMACSFGANAVVRHDFTINGRAAWLQVPDSPQAHKPWIWRARWPNSQGHVNTEMLTRGVYVGYVDVADLYGNAEAVAIWDAFYTYVIANYGLYPKPAMMGVSRGGLPMYNWAKQNPQKVACILGSVPVLDFKSWPGGFGVGSGAAGAWATCKAAYGFASDAEAIAYAGNPIDTYQPLVSNDIPVLHFCGADDTVVPYTENTQILAERYQAAGGRMDYLVVPGDHQAVMEGDELTEVLNFLTENTDDPYGVASVFSDNMVLQRGANVPVWGTGTAGEDVSVSFDGQVKVATVGVDGNWRVDLDPLTANATEQQLVVSDPRNTNTLTGILVGDVWLASGQSNMEFSLANNADKENIIAAATNNLVRFLRVPNFYSAEPQDTFTASWKVDSASTVPSQSAIAVIFAHRVQPEIGIPLGVITAAAGSSSAECWVSNETATNSTFLPTMTYWNDFIDNWDTQKATRLQTKLDAHIANPATAAAYDIDHPSTTRTYPTGCYNGMLNQLFPFSLTGVIWRQGEANWGRAEQYRHLMPFLIDEWRTNFEQPNLPFIQAQLPEQKTVVADPEDNYIAELRESQYVLTQTQTNVEMAVLIDVNDPTGDVHPKNKQLDGERMALLALAKVYNQSIPHQGPTYKEMVVEGSSVRISFDHVYGGLMIGERESYTSLVVSNTPSASIANFAIAGADNVFYWANAVIDGTDVVVSSPSVSSPVSVRYAWAQNPAGCNLYNDAGLPAAPFRTDFLPLSTLGKVQPSINFFIYRYGFTLEVSTTGAGLVSRVPVAVDNYFESGDYGVYPSGTSVGLDAVPDVGSVFGAWSGDASGTVSNINVVVDANKSVTALFAPTGENFPPVFDSEPVIADNAIEGLSYTGTLADYATDVNGDSLTFLLLPGGSSWLSVSTNGTFSGSPGDGDIGLNAWTVQVDDGNGGTNQATLNITVLSSGGDGVLVDFNDSGDLANYFNNNSSASSVNTVSGGLANSGMLDFSNQAQIYAYKQTSFDLESGPLTISMYLQIGSGGGGVEPFWLGFTTEATDTTSGTHQTEGAADFHLFLQNQSSGSYDYKLGMMDNGVQAALSDTITLINNNWYFLTMTAVKVDDSTVSAHVKLYNSDGDGVVGSNLLSITDTEFASASASDSNLWGYFGGIFPQNQGARNGDNFQIEFPATQTPYEAWAAGFSLTGDDALFSADPDQDGLINLVEFALGGNPDDGDDSDLLPVVSMKEEGGTNWFEYVYRRRLDAGELGLRYYLELKSALDSGSWATNGYQSAIGTGVVDDDFQTVTNRVSTAGKTNEFIRLMIELLN